MKQERELEKERKRHAHEKWSGNRRGPEAGAEVEGGKQGQGRGGQQRRSESPADTGGHAKACNERGYMLLPV